MVKHLAQKVWEAIRTSQELRYNRKDLKQVPKTVWMSMEKFNINCTFEELNLNSHKAWNDSENDRNSKQSHNAIQESLFVHEPSASCP